MIFDTVLILEISLNSSVIGQFSKNFLESIISRNFYHYKKNLLDLFDSSTAEVSRSQKQNSQAITSPENQRTNLFFYPDSLNHLLLRLISTLLKLERAIFQTFWRLHCCAKFMFFELETSNFGYLLIF